MKSNSDEVKRKVRAEKFSTKSERKKHTVHNNRNKPKGIYTEEHPQ